MRGVTTLYTTETPALVGPNVEIVGRTAPAVVLVDYIMPVMDGGALVAALRRDPAGRAIKVVVRSGLSETMVARKIKHYDAFIQKPFALDELSRTLESCLADAKPARPARGRGAR